MAMKGHRRTRTLSVAAGLALLAASCGGGTGGETTTAAPTSSTVPATTLTLPPTPTTTTIPTTTLAPTTTADPSLPGDPVAFGPEAGDVIAVVGVPHEDELNVRAGPGTDQEILAKLPPNADDVVARGNARLLTTSLWYEVEVDGVIGWVSAAYLAFVGETTDVTSLLIADLGETPETETMLELGRIVAEAFASEDPPSRLVVTVAPSVGDLGEVTYDVIGLGDDALFGLRLHVFGTPSESGEGFVLSAVEQTSLCGRGVTDGLCN